MVEDVVGRGGGGGLLEGRGACMALSGNIVAVRLLHVVHTI